MNYVVARGKGGGPTLMHRLPVAYGPMTACGRYTGNWSRAFMDHPLLPIYCKACMRGGPE